MNANETYWIKIQYSSENFCWLKIEAETPRKAWNSAVEIINGIVCGIYQNGEMVY